MFFQSFGLKAVASAAVIMGALAVAPAAHAFSVGDTLELTSNDVLKYTNSGGNIQIDFGNNGFDITGATNPGSVFVANGSTGVFNAYQGNFGSIKDLSISPATPTPYLAFIQINPDLTFDLTSFISQVFPVPGNRDVLSLNFAGVFRNSSGISLGDGLMTANIRDLNLTNPGVGSYSLSIEVIPTPALLPGLVAMGVGAVRKRKQLAKAEADA